MKTPNNRLKEWEDFSQIVKRHILKYANSQYGEKGDASDPNSDQISKWSVEDILVQLKKYLNRYGKNSRDGQQELDFKKMAHYCCTAYWKYIETEKDKNVFTFQGNYDSILDEIKQNDDISKNKEFVVTIKEK